MIAAVKPPEKYRIAWSQDPALKLPDLPEGHAALALPEDSKERRAALDEVQGAALRLARETGDWSRLIPDPKKSPTWFWFRWLPEMPYRRWWDHRRERGGDMGTEEALGLLFQMALVDVENFGGPVRRIEDPRVRCEVASPEILDVLKASLGRSKASALVTELAACVFEHEEITGPKS